MNKWRLLLFSVFGLLQITTSDRNFINGRYTCCDHSQRYSESDTRIIAYEPFRVLRDLPDLQQRKLLDRLSLVEEQVESPNRNVRNRAQLSRGGQPHVYDRDGRERRSSRERNYENNHSVRDASRQDRLARSSDKLPLNSRFTDVSRYSYKFSNADRVNRENKNIRQYDVNTYLPVQRNLNKGLRNNERFVRETKNSEESVIETRRNVVSDDRLQQFRNIDKIRRDDLRLTKRNTRFRNRSLSEKNISFDTESSEIKEIKNNRRVNMKHHLDSLRYSLPEELRANRNENRNRNLLASERMIDVRRQLFTQLRTSNTLARHIRYSTEMKELYDIDNSRSISSGLRNIRIMETYGREQSMERTNRRERNFNMRYTESIQRQESYNRRERNELRELRIREIFDYKENRGSFRTNYIRNIYRIGKLSDVRSKKMIVLRVEQRRDYNNDIDRTRYLLLNRYRESGFSRNNRNRILDDNKQIRINERREELMRSVQTNIRGENNIIRESINRQERSNVKRQDITMTINRSERELITGRQDKEALREDIRLNRYNIRRHETIPRFDVRNGKMDQDVTDVIREENVARADYTRENRLNTRELVRDVSRISIRDKQRYRVFDDARREGRGTRENNQQYILNIRQDWSSSRFHTASTLRGSYVQRTMNINNEQLLGIRLGTAQEKRDFRNQERDMSRRHNRNGRELLNSRRDMDESLLKQNIYETSVHGEVLNMFQNNQYNLVDLDRNTKRMDKQLNIRQILAKDEPEIRRILNIDDRSYERRSVRRNNRDNVRVSDRNIRKLYDVQNNKISEFSHRRESQSVEYNLSFRQGERDNFRSRSAQTLKTYRTREDNERLLRTVPDTLTMRIYRDEPKTMVVQREGSGQTRSQSLTNNRESRDSRERNMNIRNIRGVLDIEHSNERRDMKRIPAFRDNRFRTSEKNIRLIPMTYKSDIDTFEMKWQYLFYTLQAIYLFTLLMKIPKNEGGKSKLRITTWLTPIKSLKMD